MFYTQINSYGNKIFHFYKENGKKYIRVDSAFQPSIFVDDALGVYKDVYFNNRVSERRLKSVQDHKNLDRSEGNKLYGDIAPKYQYIRNMYWGKDLKYNLKDIKIANLDIETPGPKDKGFPIPEEAIFPVSVLTISFTKEGNRAIYVFGIGAYQNVGKEIYCECVSEEELLTKFIERWQEESPDVLTGWNIDNFDIPYLVNRLSRYGLDKKLSPVEIVNSYLNQNYEKIKNISKGQGFRYNPKFYNTIFGTEILDYYWLYKKFRSNSMESFKLDFIAEEELGKGKLDYSEYKDIYDFFCKDYQKFVEYNIRDVECVDELNDKFNFINTQISFAYLTHTNYKDVFTPTKTWEIYLYNVLMDEGYILPYRRQTVGNGYAGAYTMHIEPSYYEWLMALDLDSLYPHIYMQYNISPEMRVGKIYDFMDISPKLSLDKADSRLVNAEIDLSILKRNNWTMTANGVVYSMEKQGILPRILEHIYATRKSTKKQMLILEQKSEDMGGDVAIDNEIATLDSKQLALKIFLNSYYGIIGNESFVLYDVETALAVTLSAQLSSRWIMKYTLEHVDQRFGYKIVYGDTDSVSGDSIITIMCGNGTVQEKMISDMFNPAFGEVVVNNNTQVLKFNKDSNFYCKSLDCDGQIQYKRIKYIMKKRNKKEMYRIVVKNKYVDVTSDHSLVVVEDKVLKEIKPTDLEVGSHSLLVC